MAIIRKFLAKDNYTKVDNMVAANDALSDFAFRFYVYAAGFKNGFQLNDEYVSTALGWKHDKITRAKRELKKLDLIQVEKIDRKTYFLYIGSSKITATEVMKNWHDLENI